MLAHHPISGKPIRILRTETHISSDAKTLVWVRETFAASERWQRYYTLVSEAGAAEKCGPGVSAIVIPDGSDIDAWISVLPTIAHGKFSPPLLIASGATFDALASRGYTHDPSLIIEDLFETYPFIGESVSVKDPVEKVVISIAHILRMNKVIWSSSAVRDELDLGTRLQLDAWTRSCASELSSVPADSDDSFIPRTWLIQQYYSSPNTRRAREIHCTLEKNIDCPLIDHILLLNEEDYPSIPKSPKIQTQIIGHRLTYYDVLVAARARVPENDFVIFSNSDIWCNNTLSFLWKIQLDQRRLFLALLRWEDTQGAGNPYIFGPRSDSQDTWIFARRNLDFEPTVDDFGFPFGKSGCDNAITIAMLRKRFVVVNPAYSIHTMHLHSSNVRTYDPKDVLYKTHYLYVDPTPIQYCKVERNLSVYKNNVPADATKAWGATTLRESFRRPILSVQDISAKTLCTLLQHTESEYSLIANNENLWTPPPEQGPLYNFRNAFATMDGLISDFQTIYVGSHPKWERGWEHTHQSSLMPSLHIPSLISIHIPERCQNTLSAWVLYYLPRALEIHHVLEHSEVDTPEFLVPQDNAIGSFLHDCIWPRKKNAAGTAGAAGTPHTVTVVPMMTDMNYYSENVWSVGPIDNDHFVTREHIAMLRKILPPNDAELDTVPSALFLVDDQADAVCTRGWAEEVADKVLGSAWTVRYVSATDSHAIRRKAFQNARWIFGCGDALEWCWMAQTGATVMEFMPETAVRGDIVHLAGASELRYVLGLVKREPIELQRQNALLEISRAVKMFGFDALLAATRSKSRAGKPLLLLPTGRGLEGIWAHAGDTFREMVDIWGERGYVRVERTEETGFCWWGGIGQTLLYDRPTPRWWSAIPTYQLALFGNCAPPGPAAHILRQSLWGFWPRAPRAVEAMARRGDNLRGYKDRKISSVFLGKVENGVQLAARTGADWKSAVERFSMPIDSTGKPYPYTQAEYLETLCTTRFGLCLPGFGPKCNREIEYFACGVVPIVTPGVDMKGYLVPPREGQHYFRASTPEEVRAIVEETPAAKWSAMSAAGREWWRTYASAEGLFRVTWARIEQCQPYLTVGIPKHFL